jgi:hypothetical protein
VRLAQQTGWRVWIEEEAVLLVFDGAGWIGVTPHALQNMTRQGLGTTEIRGSFGEVSSSHQTLATALWLQTMVPLSAGDTVELQGYFRAADGYFAADHTSFWGAKVG